ncbi:unnamed protein product [Paramecium sonneborni]|uniref:RING-type E3 ubiquitin transferase n=1 Tax=Paramecium sonneborni TaxID=65129 RepID=A0A8S1R6G1_9CILI|nr:unnamed protein product [Paramecium sonneborni]
MDIELLIIQQDAFSTNSEQRNLKNKSKMEILIKESNFICHSICTYQIIKSFLFLAYYQVVLNSPLHYATFLVFAHDAITFFFYIILDALTFKFNYQLLLIEDKVVNIFHLNHSLIYLAIQEVLSLFRPLNGIILLYQIQQKMLMYPLIIIRILHYGCSAYYLFQFLQISQETCLLFQVQIIEIILHWIATLIITIIIGIVIIFNYYFGKQVHFKFQSRFLGTIIDDFNEMKLRDVNSLLRATTIDCPICYQGINESDTVIQLPCHQTHLFHSQCCKQWLFQNLQCPICRNQIESKNKHSFPVPYQ